MFYTGFLGCTTIGSKHVILLPFSKLCQFTLHGPINGPHVPTACPNIMPQVKLKSPWSGGGLQPLSVGYFKGRTRVMVLLCVLAIVKEAGLDLSEAQKLLFQCVCVLFTVLLDFYFEKPIMSNFIWSLLRVSLKANCHKDELIPWRFTRSCAKAFNEWWHKRSSCQAKRTNSLAISNYQSVVALGKLPMLCQGLILPVLSHAIKSNTHVGEAQTRGFRLDLEKTSDTNMLSRSFENTVICILISIRLGIVQNQLQHTNFVRRTWRIPFPIRTWISSITQLRIHDGAFDVAGFAAWPEWISF